MGYDFRNSTIDEFTKELSSKSSVPGGGGAAGLMASVGIALSSMTAAFTVGKPKYASVNADMERILSECEELRNEALAAMDRDAEAFEPMSLVYKMPRDTEEERKARDEAMEDCLHGAALVPLSLMEICCRGIGLALELSEKGSELLLSDAGCSAAALSAALRSAYLNVIINTSSMKDREHASELIMKADKLYQEGVENAEKAYGSVLRKLQ